MRNFLCILKAWLEAVNICNYDSKTLATLYYVDDELGIKIPYRDVEQIVEGYYSAREELDRLYETLDEKEDYIRLLRKENGELKELKK